MFKFFIPFTLIVVITEVAWYSIRQYELMAYVGIAWLLFIVMALMMRR
jgi:hypothetical protein